MKFAKEYQRHMTEMEEQLPALGLKRLKEMIKKCHATPCPPPQPQGLGNEGAVAVAVAGGSQCSGASHCYVCDESFFPSLANELSAIVSCFNERAKRLLKLHLASTGFKRYFMCFANRSARRHEVLLRQGKDLVTYAILNAVAMRKISKKYDKDTVFDAVSLSCGHIFCYLCSCAAASVTVVDGLESANRRSKCPLCRRTGVFPDAMRLNQLNILLRNSCPEY